MKISMNLYIIIFFIVLNLFLPVFMSNVLMIDSKYYLNYLLWINIIGVLYFLLPGKVGSFFNDE
jgi:hypothetical protein